MALPKRRLLIIEDEPGVAELLKKVCLSLDDNFTYQVEMTSKLSSGLERLQKEGFDLIFLDLNLPDSRGYETFGKVRSQGPRIPIVVVTGLEDQETAKKVVEEGARAYLRKGQLDLQEIASTLQNALAPSGSQ